jgi:hypothetical protein
MRCEEYRAALLAGLDTATMRAHAAGCADCRRLTPELVAAAARLGDGSLWEEPAPELEGRIVALVAGATPGSPAAPAPRRRRPGPILAAAVAGVAAIVVTVVAWGGLRSPAPDWEVAITGTDLSPQARGVVRGWNVDSGTRVTFDVSGLDPAPPGFFYEVWFSRDQVHVSAGTFRAIDDAATTVGVARRDYPRIWVTLEPADQDEAPSWTTVLDTG